MDNAQVTEADRKAYLALNMLPEKYREAIMAGEWDSTTGMQVLARHRLERSEPVGWMYVSENGKRRAFSEDRWAPHIVAEIGATEHALHTTPPEPVAEIERLRGALVSIARETVGVVPEVLNLQMCIHTVNDVARAALGDAS